MKTELNREIISHINTIVDAKLKNKLVVFAGAGISVDSDAPSWKVLIDEIKSELSLSDKENDYLKIAQMYYDRFGPKKYIDKIRKVLKHKKLKYNDLHELIFKLEPLHVITTNWDNLLEQVIEKEALPFSVIKNDNDFPHSFNNKFLLKIHGDLDFQDTIVFKEEDYLQYSKKHPLFENYVKSMFATNVVLFIGYSFSDINLKPILDTVRNILGKDFQKAYLLNVDENLDINSRDYLRNRGIEVVNYYDFNFQQHEKTIDGKIVVNTVNYIENYLNGSNVFKKRHDIKPSNLYGGKTFNLIKFISVYESFYESIKDENFIEQLYHSLNRFSEFTSLPPDFIAKLFPFKINDIYESGYEHNSIKTDNEKLSQFFDEYIVFENGQTIFKNEKVSQAESKRLNEKLKQVIRWLNASQIYYFEIKQKSEGRNIPKKYIDLKNTPVPPIDDFNDCLWNLKLDSLTQLVENYNILDSNDLLIDMQFAFALTKLGNYKKAQEVYRLTASKAWKSQKKMIHVLAKRNEKYCKNFLRWDFNTGKNENIEKTIEELSQINFQKILSNFSELDNEQLELLYFTVNNQIIKDKNNEIQSKKKALENTKKIYDGRGFSWGTDEYSNLRIECLVLFNYNFHNCLINDEFSEYTNIFNLFFEASLISFSTNERYANKLKEFDELFFTWFIFYGESKEFEAFLKMNNVKTLLFSPETMVLVIEKSSNFFKSFYQTSTFLGAKVYKNESFSNYLSNKLFEQKLEKFTKNILLILKYTNFNTENVILIENLINFLKVQTFLTWGDIENISQFLNSKKEFITENQLVELFELVLTKPNVYISHRSDFLQLLGSIYYTNKFSNFKNQALIRRIIIEIIESKNSEFYNELPHIFNISNIKNKKLIKDNIIIQLKTNYNDTLHFKSAGYEIINFNDFIDEYLTRVPKRWAVSTNGYDKSVIDKFNHEFIYFIINIINFKINRNKIKSQKFVLEPYQQFYLYPNSFDMNLFNVDWLLYNEWHPQTIFNYLKKSRISLQISKALKSRIDEKYNEKLAEIYLKYFSF